MNVSLQRSWIRLLMLQDAHPYKHVINKRVFYSYESNRILIKGTFRRDIINALNKTLKSIRKYYTDF